MIRSYVHPRCNRPFLPVQKPG